MSCPEVMYQAYYPYLYQRPPPPPHTTHPHAAPHTHPHATPHAAHAAHHSPARPAPFQPFATSATHQYDRITGIILLSIGSVILGVYHDYQHFLDDEFFSVPSLLMAVGAIIFFIAFFGCCGAVRENYCMIITFTTLLVLVFIMELAGGISGYVLRNHAPDVIGDKMNASMHHYNESKEITFVWDELQKEFECCGTYNSSDWEAVFGKDNLPMSCCKTMVGAIGKTTCNSESANLYKKSSCLPKFLEFIKGHAVQLGGVGLGIAFVQMMGIWFSVFLARSIKNNYETV